MRRGGRKGKAGRACSRKVADFSDEEHAVDGRRSAPYFGHAGFATKLSSTLNERMMKAIRKAIWPRRMSFLTSGLLLLSIAPVSAGQCPRGEIFRVSKNACIDKAEAVKLGIVHGSAGAPKPDAAQKPEDDGAAATESPAEAAAQQQASVPVAPRPESHASPPATTAPPSSPYGALTLENFAKPQ
jgi:hypothetical protein